MQRTTTGDCTQYLRDRPDYAKWAYLDNRPTVLSQISIVAKDLIFGEDRGFYWRSNDLSKTQRSTVRFRLCRRNQRPTSILTCTSSSSSFEETALSTAASSSVTRLRSSVLVSKPMTLPLHPEHFDQGKPYILTHSSRNRNYSHRSVAKPDVRHIHSQHHLSANFKIQPCGGPRMLVEQVNSL
jgi:hypothetical protein